MQILHVGVQQSQPSIEAGFERLQTCFECRETSVNRGKSTIIQQQSGYCNQGRATRALIRATSTVLSILNALPNASVALEHFFDAAQFGARQLAGMFKLTVHLRRESL